MIYSLAGARQRLKEMAATRIICVEHMFSDRLL
jgi:hypothetical protein